MSKQEFIGGQHVILVANKREGWPREEGIYQGPSGKKMCIVSVFERYRHGRFDDGIREIETRFIKPLMQPHKPQLKEGRCCWVCGKPGGAGFTTALKLCGYDVPRGAIAYAHNKCVVRAQQKLLV